MTDRKPGAPGQYKVTVTPAEFQKLQAGEQFTMTLVRDDQPIAEGTPYSKAAVLPDELAALLCPDIADPTPADALSALNTGKAPAGYGLGGNGKEISDCHVPASGFYRWDIGCANAPFEFAEMLSLNRYGSGTSNRLAFCSGGTYNGCIAHKVSEGEWEFLNPPMLPGVEYRTTERFNGYSVYTQLIDLGSLPANAYKNVDVKNTPSTRVIDLHGYAGDDYIPGWADNPAWSRKFVELHVHYEPSLGYFVITAVNRHSFTISDAKVLVKYIKI